MKRFLTELLNNISKVISIPTDKIAHFAVNFILAMTGFFRVWLAVGLCIGASIGKEYGDMNAKGNKWSWVDILADFLGMALGLGIVFLIKGGKVV